MKFSISTIFSIFIVYTLLKFKETEMWQILTFEIFPRFLFIIFC